VRSFAAAALFLAVLAPGCRAPGDFRSNNRTSREFLKDTFRQGRALSRKSLREGAEFRSGGAEYGRDQRTRGMAFAVDSARAGRRTNARLMWDRLKAEFDWDVEEHRRSNRFGFLDSGE